MFLGKALAFFTVTIVIFINSYKGIDARPSEVNDTPTVRLNFPEGTDTTQLKLDSHPSEYDYEDEADEDDPFYTDYENDEDYYDDLDDYNTIDEVVQSKSFRPPDLPLAEMTINRTLHLRLPSRHAPEYMMKLYEKFSHNKQVLPRSNIVRSFQNINEEAPVPEQTDGQLKGMNTRVHTLVFNITNILSGEHVDLAKIRLYKLVSKDRKTYMGLDRKVSVFEVFLQDPTSEATHKLISSKHIYGRNSGWESFDVTSAVRRWVRFINSLQVLEVRIETVFNNPFSGNLDIDTRHDHKRDPLLVVFSSDDKRRRLHAKELKELIEHEQEVSNQGSLDIVSNLETLRLSPRDDSSIMMSQTIPLNLQDTVLHRVKRAKKGRRSKKNSSCRRKPMYVNFSTIGWNDWIIAPLGYEAFECTGRCNFPLSDHLTPTKHAIIQTLMHTTNSKKISRACCVPTKLDAMSILYIDQQGNAVFKYKYEGMIVAECGCR